MPFIYNSKNIQIGNLSFGGSAPIRVQSMTNTNTNDIAATVMQCKSLFDLGCEMVRITAQGIKEAENLSLIKKELHSQGYKNPLVADIHFNPKAAEVAAAIVEKVRINPGNYADKREITFKHTEKSYGEELERIAERIYPLLQICKMNGTAIRIGVNHGSLSGRIMERYGDTTQGMVESAMEFGRICQHFGFENLVFSMKSSNVHVMNESTRMLARALQAENLNFPIHLGVTEAGNGEDGIIKSAVGIGSLLENGIGDTIRVSLTGSPEQEIPVAQAIVKRYAAMREKSQVASPLPEKDTKTIKRETKTIKGIGGNKPIQVIINKENSICIVDEKGNTEQVITPDVLTNTKILEGNAAEIRKNHLSSTNIEQPIILHNTYKTSNILDFNVQAAIDFGSLILDNVGDALYIDAPQIAPFEVVKTAFGILQATRARITRTEFISCPSCGRTLFDIEKALTQVKAATDHLKGLKIAVMGCIVNGPGEMADADYGYVGAGPGLVSIYKGNSPAYRNIKENEAIPLLIKLIKDSGDWKEPEI